jgi:uncharacterized membrane protein
MGTGRLEAFSDGVIAIVITIMVLEMEPPHASDLKALGPILPTFVSYVLSFLYVGIYWSNHHHLFQAAQHVTGMTLWANLHLLFWISLIPFVTRWMDESHFGATAVAAYGVVLLLCGVAWEVLRRVLLRGHAAGSPLTEAIGRGVKEWASLVVYGIAIGMAFVAPVVSCLLYLLVATSWFVPDRRLERAIRTE